MASTKGDFSMKEELKRIMHSKARAMKHRKNKRKAAIACLAAMRDFLISG